MDGCGGGALASELAQVQAMVRELEARMDQDLPAAARELCGELACGWDSSLMTARMTRDHCLLQQSSRLLGFGNLGS